MSKYKALPINSPFINATAEFISYSVYSNLITKEKTISGAIVFEEFTVSPHQSKKERMNFIADGIEFKGARFFCDEDQIKLSDIKTQQLYSVMFDSVTKKTPVYEDGSPDPVRFEWR